MPKLAFLSVHDPSPSHGNRGGCTFDHFIRLLEYLLICFNRHSIPGPPLTPQDFVSYLVSQNVEVGIIPQGIGEASMDAWAAQNLRFDAGWVRGFDFPPT